MDDEVWEMGKPLDSHREDVNETFGEMEKNGIERIELHPDLDEIYGVYGSLDRANLLLIGLLGAH